MATYKEIVERANVALDQAIGRCEAREREILRQKAAALDGIPHAREAVTKHTVALLKASDEFDNAGPFRLIGMAAYDLIAIDERVQLDLFNPLARRRRLEVAIDTLAVRFGADVVHRASDLNAAFEFGTAPTLDFMEDRGSS